jgi:hypothetical protein
MNLELQNHLLVSFAHSYFIVVNIRQSLLLVFAGLDALLADSKHQADDIFAEEYLSPLLDSCRPGASAEARYLSEDSPNSEYQPISDPYSSILYGDLGDEGMFSAPGAGYQHRLESAPWNSMPGARHVPGS